MIILRGLCVCVCVCVCVRVWQFGASPLMHRMCECVCGCHQGGYVHQQPQHVHHQEGYAPQQNFGGTAQQQPVMMVQVQQPYGGMVQQQPVMMVQVQQPYGGMVQQNPVMMVPVQQPMVQNQVMMVPVQQPMQQYGQPIVPAGPTDEERAKIAEAGPQPLTSMQRIMLYVGFLSTLITIILAIINYTKWNSYSSDFAAVTASWNMGTRHHQPLTVCV
jgi:hypothetical protein